MDEPSNHEMDTLRLLAAGLVRQHVSCQRGAILDARDDRGRTVTPDLLLRAQARISRMQIASDQLATADSLHTLVADASRPLREWAPAAMLEGIKGLDDLILIDPKDRLPTSDCIALAQEGRNLDDFRENEWHDRLRASLSNITSAKARAEAYTALRRFIVENPVASASELRDLTNHLDDITLEPVLGPLVQEMYRPAGEKGTTIRRCEHCHSLIEESPSPHCSYEACRLSGTAPSFSPPLPVAEAYRLRRELAYYWVNPGRAELQLFKELKRTREDVILYPNEDEADIAIGSPHEVGIDLKDHRSMPSLARQFQKSRGGLASYKRGIVVVTDRGTPTNGEARRDQLREELKERNIDLEVMTMADVIKNYGKGGQA